MEEEYTKSEMASSSTDMKAVLSLDTSPMWAIREICEKWKNAEISDMEAIRQIKMSIRVK